MNRANDIELAAARAKLARLEAHFDARRKEPAEDRKLRELSLRSVKRTINQLKEEIARIECGLPARRRRTELGSERELANTREKLRRLEEMYDRTRAETGGDVEVRQAEMQSLKGTINQFKEEIACYEAHQPAQR